MRDVHADFALETIMCVIQGDSGWSDPWVYFKYPGGFTGAAPAATFNDEIG